MPWHCNERAIEAFHQEYGLHESDYGRLSQTRMWSHSPHTWVPLPCPSSREANFHGYSWGRFHRSAKKPEGVACVEYSAPPMEDCAHLECWRTYRSGLQRTRKDRDGTMQLQKRRFPLTHTIKRGRGVFVRARKEMQDTPRTKHAHTHTFFQQRENLRESSFFRRTWWWFMFDTEGLSGLSLFCQRVQLSSTVPCRERWYFGYGQVKHHLPEEKPTIARNEGSDVIWHCAIRDTRGSRSSAKKRLYVGVTLRGKEKTAVKGKV